MIILVQYLVFVVTHYISIMIIDQGKYTIFNCVYSIYHRIYKLYNWTNLLVTSLVKGYQS